MTMPCKPTTAGEQEGRQDRARESKRRLVWRWKIGKEGRKGWDSDIQGSDLLTVLRKGRRERMKGAER